MNTSRVIIVQQYDVKTGSTSNTFLVDAEAVKAAGEWIARNRQLIPPPEEIGMVMPYCVVYDTLNGDLAAPTSERIEVYHKIDSYGTIAIPRDQIDELLEIVRKWGQPEPA